MEENKDYKQQISVNEEEDFELNHSDKLVGVFTEPTKTFERMAKFPPKTVDWLLPLILLIIVAVLANFVMMSNPTIRYNVIEKNLAQVQNRLDKMVEEGKLTREQADSQLEMTRKMMEGKGVGIVLQAVGTTVSLFLIFFIIAAVFHIFVKTFLKGEGNYSSSLVAYGLPYYILIIEIILTVIAAMITDRMFTDLSVASFAAMDKSSFLGFILSKVDIFSIWYYTILGIGLAKMHKAKETGKYIALVYVIWLGFGIIFYFLGQNVTILRSFMK